MHLLRFKPDSRKVDSIKTVQTISVPVRVYSDLLEALYAAAVDESRWPEFLSRLCEVTDSVIAFLIRNHDGMGRRFLASGGSAPPQGENGYTTADPVREAFMRNPRAGIIEVEEFLPHSQLIRSEYYPAMAALGVTYGTCIVPALSVRHYELISIWRSGKRPTLARELTELLTMLFPHIQNVLKIHQALGITEERSQNAEAILDASANASLLLSASGHLLYMNEVARKLTFAGDGLVERNGRIVPTDLERRSAFNGLVSAAASRWDYPGGAMMIERTSRKRPLQLLVSSFHTEGLEQTPRVLVLVTEPDRIPHVADTILRQLYGLTTAEAEIAIGLLTGFSPEAIAAIRRVSTGTVRTQIKSLLSKTGTQRQIDLVRLLCTLPNAPRSASASSNLPSYPI